MELVITFSTRTIIKWVTTEKANFANDDDRDIAHEDEKTKDKRGSEKVFKDALMRNFTDIHMTEFGRSIVVVVVLLSGSMRFQSELSKGTKNLLMLLLL